MAFELVTKPIQYSDLATKKRHFIAALKDNRLIALSEEDRKKKRFIRVDELDFTERTSVRGWLKEIGRAHV